MSAVAEAFEKAAAENRAAVVGYLPAGFPSVDGAIAAAVAMAQAGADVLEIGLPYSDPLMDGPVIQEAVHHALAGGVRVTDVLATVEAVAAAGVPVLVMTYWNPVDHYGVAAFARDLAAAGGSGLITPDLTPEEAGPWLAAAAEHDLDRVFLVAPSSSERRIKLITQACRGFVYAASLMGTTGARESVGGQAAGLVGRVREHTALPVAVGLGVRDGAQAAAGGRVRRRGHRGLGVRPAAAGRRQPGARPGPASRSLAAELAAGVRAAAASRPHRADLRRKSHVNAETPPRYNDETFG